MLVDYILYSIRNIAKRKIRSWLTMIGIFIGIAAVVSLISLGEGLQNAITQQFQELGSDKLIVQPKGAGFGFVGTNPNKLTKNDIDGIKKINGIKHVFGSAFAVAKIGFDDREVVYFVHDLPANKEEQEVVKQMHAYKLESGRDLKKEDKSKVVVGYRYAHDKVFDKNLKLGDKILVNDREFEIVGLLQKIGSEYDDSMVYMASDDMQELFSIKDEYDFIDMQVEAGINPKLLIPLVDKSLRKTRNVEEGQEDFEVQTFDDVLNSFLTIFKIVQTVVVGMAAISLLVGGIGIMNTMYTAVVERTREIGIMKAIGARNSDILLIFLIESGFLGLAGGIIGVLIGMGISKSVEIVGGALIGSTLLQAYFPSWLIAGALAFATIIGMLSGILPAKQASSLQPVDALRYE